LEVFGGNIENIARKKKGIEDMCRQFYFQYPVYLFVSEAEEF
jgi:hypothetical protein